MNPFKAIMPLIATLSSAAQATPPAIVAPVQPAPPPNYVVPKVPLVLAPPWRDALSHDRNLTKEDIAGQISSGYAGNPNYLQGVLDGEKQIPFIKQKDYQLRDNIVQFAIENNKDPRVFLSQVLHETNNFKDYPSFNPGGIKPSSAVQKFIKEQPDDSKAQVAGKLIQDQRTRENLTPNVAKLKNYFAKSDTKFVVSKKEMDVLNLTNEQVADLNLQLNYARSVKNTPEDPEAQKEAWQILAGKIQILKQVFPEGRITNKFFRVTQPFMKYENIQDGLRDMQRARGGKKDQSTWNLDAAGNINRLDAMGKPMGSYKGTK